MSNPVVKYSIVIAVFNRPSELSELLESLTQQTVQDFEVVVVDDGSTLKSDEICAQFSSSLDIKYFHTVNQGQGFARNFGMQKASGTFFILTDSDCIFPNHYMEEVQRKQKELQFDVYGGRDQAHASFSDFQKAINYSMTSFFTTGGLRGAKKKVMEFLPRSFNMGLTKEVFEKTKGFLLPQKAEDLDLSLRIKALHFKVAFLEDAFVYHKRRSSPKLFFKQIFFFGQGRISLSRTHSGQLKIFHFFPLLYLMLLFAVCLSFFICSMLFTAFLSLLVSYNFFIFVESYLKNFSLRIALLSIFTSNIQHCAYALGMCKECLFKK